MRCLENKHSRTELKSRERWGVFHCHFRGHQTHFGMSFQQGWERKKELNPSALSTLGQQVGTKRIGCPLPMLEKEKRNAIEGCVWWQWCWWTVSMPPCTCGNGRRVYAPMGNTYVYLLLNVQRKYTACLPGKGCA